MQVQNPALKKPSVKATTSEKFMENISFENLLFNSDRVLQLIEGDQSEIFQDCRDFHIKWMTLLHESGLTHSQQFACENCLKVAYIPQICRSKTKYNCAREVVKFFHDFKMHLDRLAITRCNNNGQTYKAHEKMLMLFDFGIVVGSRNKNGLLVRF